MNVLLQFCNKCIFFITINSCKSILFKKKKKVSWVASWAVLSDTIFLMICQSKCRDLREGMNFFFFPFSTICLYWTLPDVYFLHETVWIKKIEHFYCKWLHHSEPFYPFCWRSFPFSFKFTKPFYSHYDLLLIWSLACKVLHHLAVRFDIFLNLKLNKEMWTGGCFR